MLNILIKLKEKWIAVLDELIEEYRKVTFFEAKAEGDEFKARVILVLGKLCDMYNKDPKKLYTFTELWKRVQESVKALTDAERNKIHRALLKLGALDKLNTSDGGPLYMILPKILEVKPEDILQDKKERWGDEKEEKGRRRKKRK
jgi:hypothetical protein